MSLVGDHLYVISGYGSVRHYASDAWRLSLKAPRVAAIDSQQVRPYPQCPILPCAACNMLLHFERRKCRVLRVSGGSQF